MRLLAFHLPQFHPIPENDEWWGRGFTEWTNVVRARPQFRGHHQPHLPADLGFYDLRLPEARLAQAEMAQAHGIDGFVYYHYWFTGRRVLERPVDEILASGEPDFPFCLCWANENWTRAWDGRSGQNLLIQQYSDRDDLDHIHHLMPALADRRYIRINGRPLLLVYRVSLLPDPAKTAGLWRDAALRAGIGELHLACVESMGEPIDPRRIGFDAAVEFAPDWRHAKGSLLARIARRAAALHPFPTVHRHHRLVEYRHLVERMLAKPDPGYRLYRCVTPGFDNSARRNKDATIFVNGTPERYESWLREVLEQESAKPVAEDDKVVFVNAWNEWAEGNHLEPDAKWGNAYLVATRRALDAASAAMQSTPNRQPP